jgi:hypothetical protein
MISFPGSPTTSPRKQVKQNFQTLTYCYSLYYVTVGKNGILMRQLQK